MILNAVPGLVKGATRRFAMDLRSTPDQAVPGIIRHLSGASPKTEITGSVPGHRSRKEGMNEYATSTTTSHGGRRQSARDVGSRAAETSASRHRPTMRHPRQACPLLTASSARVDEPNETRRMVYRRRGRWQQKLTPSRSTKRQEDCSTI